jgi:hypothetical protein
MRVNGKPVRACRLFLGNEYRTQIEYLHRHFQKEYGYHRDVKFDNEIYRKLKNNLKHHFHFEHISTVREQPAQSNYQQFDTFETALHQLVLELVELQAACIHRALGTTAIRKIYIDGGFADNDTYVQMMADFLPDFKLRTTRSPLGSALGAAIITVQPELNKKFLKQKYAMKKLVPRK